MSKLKIYILVSSKVHALCWTGHYVYNYRALAVIQLLPRSRYLTNMSRSNWSLVSKLIRSRFHSNRTPLVSTSLHLILILGKVLTSNSTQFIISHFTPSTSFTFISIILQSFILKSDFSSINSRKVLSLAVF